MTGTPINRSCPYRSSTGQALGRDPFGIFLGALLYLLAFGVSQASTVDSAADAYRLRLENPGSFRLGQTSKYQVRPPPRKSLAKMPFSDLVQKAADRQGLDPALLHAMIHVESGYNPAAISPQGATGLMQLMPATASRYGVRESGNPEQNLDGAAAYLRYLLKRFDNDISLALAAYNAGEGAVEEHHRHIPPYAETRRYVPAVLDRYRQLSEPQQSPYQLIVRKQGL